MKINILLIIGTIIIAGVLSSCENKEVTYPDFAYRTVYFANQYPVRTLELGEELFVDNSMDNEHKVVINATTGGGYTNNNDIIIDFIVDETLCDSLYYIENSGNGSRVLPMPSNYYELAQNQITIQSGSLLGGVEVQLTDAFFEDTNSLKKNYVIPLLLTDVQGADSILSGLPVVDNPDRCIDANWSIKPRNFILYAIKYINPWHGNYLRRGIDQITQLDGSKVSFVRHAQYVEENETLSISTVSLTEASLSVPLYSTDSSIVWTANLLLTFTDDENCIVSGNDMVYSVSGTGKFVSKGDKNSIGGIDRSALFLDYKVEFNFFNLTYETRDTLTVRDRGVAPEYFSVERR
jgi:hypothetical protein